MRDHPENAETVRGNRWQFSLFAVLVLITLLCFKLAELRRDIAEQGWDGYLEGSRYAAVLIAVIGLTIVIAVWPLAIYWLVQKLRGKL